MRHIELAGLGAFRAANDALEGAVGREVHDPRIAIAIGHEDVTAGHDEDIGRAVEVGLGIIATSDTARAERQEQLAVRRELLDEVVGVVSDPEEPFVVDPESVRDAKQVLAPRAYDIAGGCHHHEERIRATKDDDLSFRRRRDL